MSKLNNNNNNVDYSTKILEVKNLKQYFKVGSGKNKLTVKAVDDISFDVYKREIFGLVGESGSGKTTAGRSIIKLYNPTDGEVKFDGNVIAAGTSGYYEQIKNVKENYKFDVIKANKLTKDIYLLQTEADKKINKIVKQKQTALKKIKKQQAKFQSDNEAYFIKLDNLKSDYLLERDNIKHLQDTEISLVKHEEVKEIYKHEKRYFKIAKVRYDDKLKAAKADKVNGLKLAEVAKNNYELEISKATAETLISLEKVSEYELTKYKVNRKIDTSAALIQRLEKLEVTEKAKKANSDEKNQIIAIKAKYAPALVALEKKYNQDRLDILKSKSKFTENNSILASIRKEASEKVSLLDEEIKVIKTELNAKIAEIKADYKANPDKYPIDQAALEKAKEVKKERLADLKLKITIANKHNDLKELPADKKIRLEKLEVLKQSYLADLAKIDKTDFAATQELKKIYDKQKREINASRPSYRTHVLPMQMIFQDPISSLNPRMVVREIIAESLRIQGVSDDGEINDRVNKVLNAVGLLPDHATRYVHEFSGGQRQRIGIARALISDTKFIIADEPVSALDVSIQAQVINLLNDLKDNLGLTILFIAHDLSVVKYFSDRIAVMFAGKIVELASSEEIFANPLHPYTKSLLSAIPQPDPITEKTRKRLPYDPTTHNYETDKPNLVEIKEGHFVYGNDTEIESYKKELGL